MDAHISIGAAALMLGVCVNTLRSPGNPQSPIRVRPSRGGAEHLDGYARFTSPGRRSEDLINLACLMAAADGLPEPFTFREMTAFADAALPAALRSSEANRLRALPAQDFRRLVARSVRGMPHAVEAEFARRLAC